MNTLVQKWGNSLAIRLPKALANEAHICQGSLVDLSLEDGGLRVQLVSPPEFNLDALLAGVTKENLHEAIDVADGVGAEVL